MSSYLRVLRFPNFRYLFLGQSASSVGDQVVIVALALYVTERTGSATDLGFVLAAQALPMIALILFGGVWADRFGGPGRRRIMIGADSVRAGLHLTLAALIFAGGASVFEMIVIEALFGAARAFFNPAYAGLVPQTVPDDHVQEAQALSGLTANLAIMVGPAIGTVLILTVGAGAAFGLDAATFVISAALLMRVNPRARGTERNPETVIQSLRAGFGEVASRPWVWATISAFCVAVLFSYSQWYSLAPSIAKEFYGGADRFGVLEIGRRRRGRARCGDRHQVAAQAPADARLGADPVVAAAGPGVRDATAVRDGDLAGVQRRADVRAVRDLVGDRARAPHPGGRAVPRQLV